MDLRFRSYCGEEDIVAIADLLNATADVDGPESARSPEEVRRELGRPMAKPEENVLLCEQAGKLVAYGRTVLEEGTEVSVFRVQGAVHPDWRRRGVGLQLMTRLEGRASARQGQIRGQTAYIGSEPSAERQDCLALFRRLGYEEARYFFDMERPLRRDGAWLEIPEARFPPGISVHSLADRYALRAVWQAAEEAFRDHWEHTEFPFEVFRHWTEGNPHWRPEMLSAAWESDKDEVAGMCLTGMDPERNERTGRQEGWVYAVAVRRAFRRRGLGRALLLQGLGLLQEAGMESAMLTVDAANLTGALRLYEGVGFRTVKRYIAFRKQIRASCGEAARSQEGADPLHRESPSRSAEGHSQLSKGER
jgi:mycothiol synthase